ncbi:histidine phosphatase family protein [Gorillibacterium massiliense]|uniref:histidine phosphatase family protein n=1 Tax=Gorillibacterium massiliense TaxID=1280390 RepID=UPI0004B83AAE|nr:histidine phosphatase family protein [Gorillibacterium massiliense]
MDLIIIRHGQSEADLLHVHEGRADFSLTELGNKQARSMADWLVSNYKIAKIYSSTLKRARQTAQYLSNAGKIAIHHDDDLMEFQNGFIAGLSREEARLKYPMPAVKFPHTAVHGQESLIQFRMRAETALSKIIHENDPEDTVAIVSHGGMINMLFRSFLGLPTASQISISTGDTGIHHWRIDGEARRVVFANSLVHLEQLSHV